MNMKNCGNSNCKKDLTLSIRRKRKCIKCSQFFCRNCFIEHKPKWPFISLKGFCYSCYIQNNPDKLEYPKYFGEEIPSEPKYRDSIMNFINPINLNPLTEFKKPVLIGEGASSKVFKVRDRNKKPFALKVLNPNVENFNILEEFSVSVLSPCQNIVSCFALYRYADQYSILLEYMDCALVDLLPSLQGKSENLLAYILKETVKGLQFIHNRYKIHRDLKSANIFVSLKGDVKVSDFGMTAQLYREKDLRESIVGTPLWQAPEVLQGKTYTKSCDIWSLGMVCFELADGEPYFHESENYLSLLLNILKKPEPRLNEKFSQEFQQFVVWCLQKDPGERKSVEELMETEFLLSVKEVEAKTELAEMVCCYVNSKKV